MPMILCDWDSFIFDHFDGLTNLETNVYSEENSWGLPGSLNKNTASLWYPLSGVQKLHCKKKA